MNVPSISIIIATFNSSKTLRTCLQSIAMQSYPRQKIEIILADGGSTDQTVIIGKKFHAKIITVAKEKQGAEYNRGVGARAAKGSLLLFLDHDNVLPHKHWLTNMIQPIVDDTTVVGVETLYYTYNASDSLIGRYFSLFGVNDIFAFYVGKADRLAQFYDSPYHYGVFKKANIQTKNNYFIVDFAKDAIPTLGSNGFLIRKDMLFANAEISPDTFFHIDVNVDLIRKGYNRYAFINDSLYHKSHERGLFDYLRRRKLFMQKYHFTNSQKRRYSLYEKGDAFKTFLFVLFGITILVPLFDAIKGYKKIPDIAWFLNPIMCFSLVILYGSVIIQNTFFSYENSIVEK